MRSLARTLGRDVKRVHDDAAAMIEVGLIEKTEAGKLIVPFAEIRAVFVLKSAAYSDGEETEGYARSLRRCSSSIGT